MPEKKSDWLKIRVTTEQKQLFERQAEREGLSLSSWVRTHLLALVQKTEPEGPIYRATSGD